MMRAVLNVRGEISGGLWGRDDAPYCVITVTLGEPERGTEDLGNNTGKGRWSSPLV